MASGKRGCRFGWRKLWSVVRLAVLSFLHHGCKTRFKGCLHLVEHLLRVEWHSRSRWTWRSHLGARWFRCAWHRCCWWWLDRRWSRCWLLLDLVMRKELLEMIDVGLGLIVELLVQQRVLLLKCRDLRLSLSLGLLKRWITSTKLSWRYCWLMRCRGWCGPAVAPHRLWVVGPATRKHGEWWSGLYNRFFQIKSLNNDTSTKRARSPLQAQWPPGRVNPINGCH